MQTDTGSAIKFIREDTPEFQVPAYRGEWQEVLAPDTLDIQERMALAVNGITGPTDPEKDHLLYFKVEFRGNPPIMSHCAGDVCQVKLMEALPLMRLASGSSLNDHVDPVWMRTALRTLGPDGLMYWPSLPWAPYPDWAEPCPPDAGHFAMPFMNGRMIGALTAYMLRDPSGPWDAEIKRLVDGLCSVAIRKDDYAYFPVGAFAPGSSRLTDAPVPTGAFSSLAGWTLHGLAQYHRVSGYEPAIKLASGLARYIAYHGRYYGPNAEYLHNDEGGVDFKPDVDEVGPPPMEHFIHFQHHMVPLLGILDHAVAVGDKELCEFVRKGYEWGRSQGNVTLGYFPENIGHTDRLETSETCEVAGMIALAIKLSAAGIADYWDDADCWIRNQFVENQLTQPEWVYRMAEAGLVTGKTRIPRSAVDPVRDTADNVPERNVGAFAGWPTANDWFVGYGSGIMHCCTGNGTRALYYIWEHILTHDNGVLSVNLLLNRASKWADIHSHIPYAGQVDVKIKQPARLLRVRIPEWVEPSDVECTANVRRCALQFDGRYALVRDLAPETTVTMTFPIPERKASFEVEKQQYHVITRGNDVVDIYPRGRFWPLYQRGHMRRPETRWKQARWFVPDETIYW